MSKVLTLGFRIVLILIILEYIYILCETGGGQLKKNLS